MIKIVNSNEQEPIVRRPKRDKESQIEKAQKNFALNKISHLESRKTPAVNIVDIGHYKLMRPTGRNHSVQVSSEIEAQTAEMASGMMQSQDRETTTNPEEIHLNNHERNTVLQRF
jgi:hypothetical protein